MITKGTGGLGSWRTSGDHPNYYIIENGQNTDKNPRDLRRLAVTQTPVKNHQLTLKWKTLMSKKYETEDTMNNTMTITREQKWKGKQLYGRFKRQINKISHDKIWTGLIKVNFKRETESLQIAAQDSAIRTNHIKAGIGNAGYVVTGMKPSIL